MAKTKLSKTYWLPLKLWNLNEVFTSESISPISFYETRGFGNPVSRDIESLEDVNYLVLLDNPIKSQVLIELSSVLIDKSDLNKIKGGYYEYPKTIYFRKGSFKVHFNSEKTLQEFIAKQFMLLEVKTVDKYRMNSFVVDDALNHEYPSFIFQPKVFSDQLTIEPYYDKAFNQVKGLIYGYVIGCLSTLDGPGEGYIKLLNTLKNIVVGSYTEIALSEEYSNRWLLTVKQQIAKCASAFIKVFDEQPILLNTIGLRLEEVDSLNKMRCANISKRKTPQYEKRNFQLTKELDEVRAEIRNYEIKNNINSARTELRAIRDEEKNRGIAKGKTRVYYKESENPEKFFRKKELIQSIIDFEKNDTSYNNLKLAERNIEESLKKLQSFDNEFDGAIKEQFNRISEQLNELFKWSNARLRKDGRQAVNTPDLTFEIDASTLAICYLQENSDAQNLVLKLPEHLKKDLSESDYEILLVSLDVILANPQGGLGFYSEEQILHILVNIGKRISNPDVKNTLRQYYNYRTMRSESFDFPNETVLANLLVFLMKLQGHDQINKLLTARGIRKKEIAFLFYGAYVGFANLPKTFTDIVFNSENQVLQDKIDKVLFGSYLQKR